MRHRIAIVGTGISGLGAAWALHRDHDITVFEAADRVGGHANTVEVRDRAGIVAVDTGFIVYNEVTYPNLTRLFDLLDVPTKPSDMSFAFSAAGRFEYGASLTGMLARPANLFRRSFRRMLADIERFRRTGLRLDPGEGETIDSVLRRWGFSDAFRSYYLYPMTGAIWSASGEDIARFPARAILRFLANHGLIQIAGRPTWRTVTGGSREYVRRLTAGYSSRIMQRTPVLSVERLGRSVRLRTHAGWHDFDHVVLATHSDQALAILGGDATPDERRLLGAIRYRPNRAVLHSDVRLMPRRRSVWSAWNAMAPDVRGGSAPPSVTYWMNRLQGLDSRRPLFVSLNPIVAPDPSTVHASFRYDHPQFDETAMRAQKDLNDLQGRGNTWFAGAYLGYGFHEDGVRSGLAVAAALGSPAPWHAAAGVGSAGERAAAPVLS